MPDYRDQKSCFIESLTDVGCEQEFIQTCSTLKENQKIEELVRVLTKYKGQLLERLHQSENQIDCLDYLIYELKNVDKHSK